MAVQQLLRELLPCCARAFEEGDDDAAAGPSGGGGAVGLFVPWYVWPCPLFDELIESTSRLPRGAKAAVVVGGSAGPGPERPLSQLHVEHWGRMRDAGWTLYGYVYCQRGARPLDEVAADAGGWAELYGDLVEGLFVDEAPSECDEAAAAYLRALLAAARAAGLRLAALNPGTALRGPAAAEVGAMADIVVSFEASHETWRGMEGAAQAPPGRPQPQPAPAAEGQGAEGQGAGPALAAVVHSLPPPRPGRRRAAAGAVLAEARARGFSWLFLTDAPMPNPYSQLPSFWRAEVACFEEAAAAAGLGPAAGGGMAAGAGPAAGACNGAAVGGEGEPAAGGEPAEGEPASGSGGVEAYVEASGGCNAGGGGEGDKAGEPRAQPEV